MSNKLREIEALGQVDLDRQPQPPAARRRHAARPDRAGRDQRRDLEPDDLREGHGPLGPLRRRLPRGRSPTRPTRRRSSSAWRCATSATPPTCCGPTFDATDGQDGYVSFELPAALAFDAQGSIERPCACRRLIEQRQRAHQGPGHRRGRGGVRGADRARREREHDAAVRRRALPRDRRGLRPRRLGAASRPASRSTAPPRWRASSSRAWTPRSTRSWSGSAARTCAARPPSPTRRIAYAAFQRDLLRPRPGSGSRRPGRNVQRPLWASTSTKNPDYPDTLYVDELIGPDTVNTMPDATIEAARDHATAERTVDQDVEGARALMDELREVGVDVDDIVHAPARRRGRRVVLEVLPVAAGDAGAQGQRAGGRGPLGARSTGTAGSGSGSARGSGISGAPGGLGFG